MSEPANTTVAARLAVIVHGLEALTADKREAEQALAEAFREARGQGFDVAALKKLLARRASDAVQRSEEDALVDTYADALKLADRL